MSEEANSSFDDDEPIESVPYDFIEDDNSSQDAKDTTINAHLKAMAQYIERNTGADSVQIVITTYDGDATKWYSGGRGNALARRAACEEWLDNL